MDGMILRFILESGDTVEGYVDRIHVDASHHGKYYGHVELTTEQNALFMIDLFEIKEIENITSKDLLKRYADKGIIRIGDNLSAYFSEP